MLEKLTSSGDAMLTVRILSCGRARTGERDVKLATAGRQTLLTVPQLTNIADTILQVL
jgi:hypothetical protein